MFPISSTEDNRNNFQQFATFEERFSPIFTLQSHFRVDMMTSHLCHVIGFHPLRKSSKMNGTPASVIIDVLNIFWG